MIELDPCRSAQDRAVVVIGPLPPPLHGQSQITALAVNFLVDAGHKVICCNVSTGQKRGGRYHIERHVHYANAIVKILSSPQRSTIYCSLCGGWGKLYDIAVTAASRLCKHRLVFHHHTFTYLAKKSPLTRLMVALAGSSQRHIALSPIMAAKIRELYGEKLDVHLVSNIAFLAGLEHGLEPIQADVNDKWLRLGHIANLCLEKGLDTYLDLVDAARERGLRVRAVVAGPFANEDTRRYFENRAAGVDDVEYVGPVYGREKTKFFESIDLLVLPSRLDEAEPLVIYEAKAAGVPVAVTDRGCVRDMIGEADILLDPTAADLDPILSWIAEWVVDDTMDEKARRTIERQYKILLQNAKRDLDTFGAIFAGIDAYTDTLSSRVDR